MLDLSEARVMGILNVTPNSFSDGGKFSHIDDALIHALQLIDDGADIIDVGGESTRPGAAPVPIQEELDRVIPVIEKLKSETDALISCDTSKTQVMADAITAGVCIINDVRALQDEGAIGLIAKTDVSVCLMHMQGLPDTMQDKPEYSDVLSEVMAFLQSRIDDCVANGVKANQVIVDPGFGFGKSLEHNLYLLKHIEQFAEIAPVLVGISRKTMLGQITGRDINERLSGSIAAAVYAAMHSAKIIRVHDVKETVDALKVVKAIEGIK
jgi:dihydropteroate synthase